MDAIRSTTPPVSPPVTNLQGVQDSLDAIYVAVFNLIDQLNKQQGVVQSPDGHYWRIDVDNSGVLSTTDLGTSL